MPTLLTNRRMDPALASRIEASLRGKNASGAREAGSPRLVAITRLVAIVGVIAAVYTVVSTKIHDKQELERDRRALLDAVRAESASLTPADMQFVARADAALLRFGGPYEGDVSSPEVRGRAAFAAVLARPSIYVRGPVAEFGSPTSVAAASGASLKDALLFCLKEPPAARTEAVVLTKVRLAYTGGTPAEQATSNVRRLEDARAGLPLLLPPWADRVVAANDTAEIARLRRELDRAPIDRAKQALHAEVLVVAMDEANEPLGATELDGEHAHTIRVGVIELATSKVLFRTRKRVDPTWISEGKRPRYASGLDACALAFEIHDGV